MDNNMTLRLGLYSSGHGRDFWSLSSCQETDWKLYAAGTQNTNSTAMNQPDKLLQSEAIYATTVVEQCRRETGWRL